MVDDAVNQPVAEFTEDGEVEAGISLFQAEGLLPINPASDSLGGLPFPGVPPQTATMVTTARVRSSSVSRVGKGAISLCPGGTATCPSRRW